MRRIEKPFRRVKLDVAGLVALGVGNPRLDARRSDRCGPNDGGPSRAQDLLERVADRRLAEAFAAKDAFELGVGAAARDVRAQPLQPVGVEGASALTQRAARARGG